jgi:hypothetical protein
MWRLYNGLTFFVILFLIIASICFRICMIIVCAPWEKFKEERKVE